MSKSANKAKDCKNNKLSIKNSVAKSIRQNLGVKRKMHFTQFVTSTQASKPKYMEAFQFLCSNLVNESHIYHKMKNTYLQASSLLT